MAYNKRLPLVAALIVAAVGLSGCFDLSQKVVIGRDGSGRYGIAISSTGIVGDALKDADLLTGAGGPVQKRTVIENGRVTREAALSFSKLSDVHLSDESMSITTVGNNWFGLLPTQAVFRRTFLVQNAKRRGEHRARSEEDGGDQAVLASLFGDHTYTYSVTLPGSVDWIAPLKVNGVLIKPKVTGDMFQGHTVTWRMPLGLALSQQMLHFTVGFSAYGTFGDSQSMPGGKGSM